MPFMTLTPGAFSPILFHQTLPPHDREQENQA